MNSDHYGYIYRITNQVNGKTYVGQRRAYADKGKTWNYYMGSGVIILRAIKKYGKDNFTKELVSVAFSQNELDLQEREALLKEKSEGKSEYNLHWGSPAPPNYNPYDYVSPERRSELIRELAERNHLRAEKRYENFLKNCSDKCISLFEETKNMKKVAEELGTSKVHVRRFLLENGIDLNHQNEFGAKISEAKREAIRKGAYRYVLGADATDEQIEAYIRKVDEAKRAKENKVRSSYCIVCDNQNLDSVNAFKHSRSCPNKPITKWMSMHDYVVNYSFHKNDPLISVKGVSSKAIENVSEELVEAIRTDSISIAKMCDLLECKKSTAYVIRKSLRGF